MNFLNGSETAMKKTLIVLSVILINLSLLRADDIDKRDIYIKKLKNPAETVAGAEGLFEEYQLGGVRTIIRQLNNLPEDLAFQYVYALKNLDLFRFRNDMNANLQGAETVAQKGVALMLLSSLGRRIDSDIFMKFAENPTEDIQVRLAAATCLSAIQKPKYFDLIADIAETSVVDYATGRNDFRYCDFSQVNRGLFYYLKPRLDVRKTATHGVKMVMLMVVPPSATEFYQLMLDKKDKDYFMMMINQAANHGGTELLNTMAASKRAKKLWSTVNAAKPVAALVTGAKSKLFSKSEKVKYPLGALIPRSYSVKGQNGLSASVALIKVDASGTISIVEEESVSGSKGAFDFMKGKKTMPAKIDFTPVDSMYLMVAPF